MASHHLTKLRYLAGLQCPRRLWLVVHEPLPYEAPDPGSLMDIGHVIGGKAHLLFPGGVSVGEEPWQHAEAAARTAALMNDAHVPAIFEAALEFDGIRVRVDVMERLPHGAWGLREVKSSSGLKEMCIRDRPHPVSAGRGRASRADEDSGNRARRRTEIRNHAATHLSIGRPA